jgi:hypothetical protein
VQLRPPPALSKLQWLKALPGPLRQPGLSGLLQLLALPMLLLRQPGLLLRQPGLPGLQWLLRQPGLLGLWQRRVPLPQSTESLPRPLASQQQG